MVRSPGKLGGKSTLSHVPSDTVLEISITAINTASKEAYPDRYEQTSRYETLIYEGSGAEFTVNILHKYFFLLNFLHQSKILPISMKPSFDLNSPNWIAFPPDRTFSFQRKTVLTATYRLPHIAFLDTRN